mmetsp:Transcript_15369/g.36301  ORF Transcript_15369/g.36301 Transcript_15369/m.36301 type:complete len:215 (-) Transcript_15369:353-997(-)
MEELVASAVELLDGRDVVLERWTNQIDASCVCEIQRIDGRDGTRSVAEQHQDAQTLHTLHTALIRGEADTVVHSSASLAFRKAKDLSAKISRSIVDDMIRPAILGDLALGLAPDSRDHGCPAELRDLDQKLSSPTSSSMHKYPVTGTDCVCGTRQVVRSEALQEAGSSDLGRHLLRQLVGGIRLNCNKLGTTSLRKICNAVPEGKPLFPLHGNT